MFGEDFYTIRVNKLLELNEQVADKERILPIVPIEKYMKPILLKTSKTDVPKKKSKPGKTLVEGYINRNNQENKGCLNKHGNHSNQMAYLLHCNECGFEYEANGCDVAIRKCQGVCN